MKGSPDRIQACTTTHFDGSIAVTDPEKSWVARWQRTSAFFFVGFTFVITLCISSPPFFFFFFWGGGLRMLIRGDR
jgi:hypothetical protein